MVSKGGRFWSWACAGDDGTVLLNWAGVDKDTERPRNISQLQQKGDDVSQCW